jgi:Calcium/calmodulin dependent protein kinase II association domain
MFEVKVHFFGDAIAILYGTESATHTETDGRKHTVKLTWTDTWQKRNGIWQIVAAQDMPSALKVGDSRQPRTNSHGGNDESGSSTLGKNRHCRWPGVIERP